MPKTQDKPTGAALVQQQRELVAFVDDPKLRSELVELLPANVSVPMFTRALKNSIINDPTGKLIHADKVSLYQCALRCAMDGLLPDGRDAVILPFWDGKAKKNKAQYIQMIGGQRKIAGEYGWALDARVVCEHDEFDPDVENHRANFKRAKLGSPRGEIVGAYAIAEHRDGRKIGPIVMDVDEIEKIRKESKQPEGQLWTKWYPRACEKTVAKQVLKIIPWDPKDRDRVMGILEHDESDDVDTTIARLYGDVPEAHVPEPIREPIPDEADLDPNADGDEEEVEDAEFEPVNDDGSPPDPSAATPSDTDPNGQEKAAETPAEPEQPVSSPTGSAASPKRATRKRTTAKKTAEPKPEELAATAEPPEDAPAPVEEEPRFEGMRYAGMTPSEVFAIEEINEKTGEKKGVEYLRWALGAWKTPTMKNFLEKFAEQHPEIRG